MPQVHNQFPSDIEGATVVDFKSPSATINPEDSDPRRIKLLCEKTFLPVTANADESPYEKLGRLRPVSSEPWLGVKHAAKMESRTMLPARILRESMGEIALPAGGRHERVTNQTSVDADADGVDASANSARDKACSSTSQSSIPASGQASAEPEL